MGNNRIATIDKYLYKCSIVILGENELEKKETVDEIVSVFQNSIVNLSNGLTIFQAHKTINLDKDLSTLIARLEWFKNVLEDKKKTEINDGGNLDEDGNQAIFDPIYDEATIYLFLNNLKINIKETASEKDAEITIKIINDIEKICDLKISTKDTWDLLRPIVSEISMKKNTIAAPVLKAISAVISMEK